MNASLETKFSPSVPPLHFAARRTDFVIMSVKRKGFVIELRVAICDTMPRLFSH